MVVIVGQPQIHQVVMMNPMIPNLFKDETDHLRIVRAVVRTEDGIGGKIEVFEAIFKKGEKCLLIWKNKIEKTKRQDLTKIVVLNFTQRFHRIATKF